MEANLQEAPDLARTLGKLYVLPLPGRGAGSSNTLYQGLMLEYSPR